MMIPVLSNRNRIQIAVLSAALIASPAFLSAQRGQGGRGGSGGRQGAQTSPGSPIAELPEISYDGKITDLSNEAIVVQLKDGRSFTIKRTGGTKFYKDSKEIKAADLKTGDPVSVGAREDNHGFLIATKVTFREGAADEPQVPEPVSKSENSIDIDQPVLKRRVDSASLPNASSDSGPSPTGASGPERVSRNGLEPGSDEMPSADDPLIAKAREAAFSFSDTLPNFLCSENIARFSREPRGLGWRPLDVVSSDVVYEDGQESYRNLRVNGAPTDKAMDQLSGSWSTGEFATTLSNLFHPSTEAAFRLGEDSTIQGMPARVYDFEVKQENSHWNVSSGDRTVIAAYKGSVWIDPQSARVLRIEIQATGLPSDFPLDQVESSVDYAFVQIGASSVLLPSHAEGLGCDRQGHGCNRNVIDFKNYRKYTADSKVKFDQ